MPVPPKKSPLAQSIEEDTIEKNVNFKLQLNKTRREASNKAQDKHSADRWSALSSSIADNKKHQRYGQETWTTDMINLWFSLRPLFEALNAWRPVSSRLAPFTDDLTDMAMKQWYSRLEKNKPIELPKIMHFVDLNADGALDFNGFKVGLRRSDGKGLTQEQIGLFVEPFRSWGEQNGCQFKVTKHPGTYNLIKDGRALTRDQVIALRDNPKTGLTAVLKKIYSDMEFSQLKPAVVPPDYIEPVAKSAGANQEEDSPRPRRP